MLTKSLAVLIILFLMIAAWPQDTRMPLRAMAQDATPTATQTPESPVLDTELQYRVAFVADNDVLNVRGDAGIQAAIVDTLPNDEIVQPFNASQIVGNDFWIQIQYQNGKTGWVNRAYLIATRDAAVFCDDQRPQRLISALQDAVRHLDGQKLAEVVAPRGLYLALDGDKTLLLSPVEVRGFFQDHSPRNWGRNGNTDQIVSGTLADKVTPLLQKNLVPKNVAVEIACNDNQDTLSTRDALDYITIPGDPISNFFSVMRPGPPDNDLAWGAWGLALEYWNGQPVLTGLVYYYWTP